MTDIVERLRGYDPEKLYETPIEMNELCMEAADEIERLRAALIAAAVDRAWQKSVEVVDTAAAAEIEKLRDILREMLRPIGPKDKADVERFMREGDEIERRARAILGESEE